MKTGPLFCDKGHHRVEAPKFLAGANIAGRVVINCGVKGCKGRVIIGRKVKDEKKTV